MSTDGTTSSGRRVGPKKSSTPRSLSKIPSVYRAEEIDAFVRRLTVLGAHRLRVVKEDDCYFVVMADPEGNEFCVD
jgi:predicted enzyme related to lactoylglutathione lyase